MDNEKRAAATTYIYNFYNDVQALLTFYSQYLNTLAQLRARYGQGAENNIYDEANTLDPNDTEILIVSVNNVKFISHKLYIEYLGVCKLVKIPADPEVKNFYDTLKKQVIPDAENLEKLTTAFNMVLIEDVIQEALINSQEFITQLFGHTQTGEGR